MAILQALLALISKSAGKILNAIFGWAVHALFGKTTARDQTLLSGLVGAAVAWPLLVAGVAAPKVAALALAFVPLPHWIPSWVVRLVWLGLAAAVPVALGLTLAARRPANALPESFVKRALRGFPLTLGLALAFIVMFVSIPVMRFLSLVARETSADVPLVTDVDAYHDVAGRVVEALNRHGFDLRATEPGWWVKAPTRILGWFGGAAFSGFVPERLENFVGPGLELSFYTSGVLVRGKSQRVTWAHGLIAETVVHSRGLQTYSPEAQGIERQIRRLWAVFDDEPSAHAAAQPLLNRVTELTRDLTDLDVDYDEWQVLYRQLLQVERAVRGKPQLLDGATTGSQKEAAIMNAKDEPARASEKSVAGGGTPGHTLQGMPAHVPSPETMSTIELVKEISAQGEQLIKAQLALAKAELRSNVVNEAKMAAGLGVSALAALIVVTLLLVTVVLALATVMPGWAAGLVVSGAMLAVAAVAGAVGWSKRVKNPLSRTRHELKEDVKWTKERVA